MNFLKIIEDEEEIILYHHHHHHCHNDHAPLIALFINVWTLLKQFDIMTLDC